MTFCIVFWTGCGNVLSWQVSSILSMYSMFERTLRHNEYGFVTQVHVIQLSWDLSCCADKTKNYDALHVVLSIKQNIGGPWEIIKSDKKLAYLAKIICVQFPKKIGASGFLNGLVNYLAWIFHNLLYNVMPSPIQVARNRNDLIVSTCIYTISNRKCMPPFQNLHIIQS